MTRPLHHVAAALVALLITTTTFAAVTSLPESPAPRAGAALA